MEERHDIHDFLVSAQRDIQNEYERILKRPNGGPWYRRRSGRRKLGDITKKLVALIFSHRYEGKNIV